MRVRSVFVSDVHLGTADCQAGYLLHFLQTMRCERLYLVGDIVDLEALAKRVYWPPSHSAVLEQILQMRRDGVNVTYIPGNHDAALRNLCGQSIGGIPVRLSVIHEAADGRRYHVSHGDEFDHEQVGKQWLLRLGNAAHGLLCWLNRNLNRLRRRVKLPYLPLAILTKSRIGKAMHYIRQYEQRVALHAREAQVDGHICGHIHFGAIREMDGVAYLNDGDWVEHCTGLVEHVDGRMELLHWSEQCHSLAALARRMPQRHPTLADALGALGQAAQLVGVSEAEPA